MPTSTVVQTTNGVVDMDGTPCATAPGGKEEVIDFEMPGKGDMEIDWAQVGNHDFALYQNISDQLGCAAGPLVTCVPSAAAQTGKIPLPGLAKGKYHLIVVADKPGAEGGVVLQISGVPSN
jgi:hypothetical protein